MASSGKGLWGGETTPCLNARYWRLAASFSVDLMRPANDNLDPYRFMPPKPRWGWLWALLAFSVPVMLAVSLIRLWIGWG